MTDSDAPPFRRRRGGGLYPLWLGALALAGFTALWFTTADEVSTPAAADAAVADPSAPERPAADGATPAPEPTRLLWTVGPRPPMDGAVLDDCLASAGFDRAAAVGVDPIVITYPGRVRPISLRASTLDGQSAVELSTPVEADARLSAALHVAATACLYVEGAQVHDPLFDRRMTPVDWPQLSEGGGLPVRHLIDVRDVPGGQTTRGLNRLGRSELGVAVGRGEDGATAYRFLRAYAAAAVVAPADSARLERDGGYAARLIGEAEARAAGFWTAPSEAGVERRVLAAADGDPPRPLALPRRAPRPEKRRPETPQPEKRPEKRPAESGAPKPPARRDPKPGPTRPPKPRPPKPDAPFSPAYR